MGLGYFASPELSDGNPYFGLGICEPVHRPFMSRHQLTAARGAAKTVKPTSALTAVTPGAKAARSCSPTCSAFTASISAGATQLQDGSGIPGHASQAHPRAREAGSAGR
jgi:hypothetical protein